LHSVHCKVIISRILFAPIQSREVRIQKLESRMRYLAQHSEF
jgi:hypothetical protein